MQNTSLDPSFYQAFECFRFDSAAAPDLFPIRQQSHYFSEVLLVRSGTCRVIRGGYTHILGPGELIYIASLIRHSVESADGGPVVFDVVKYSATRLKEIPSYIRELRALSADVAQVLVPIQMTAEDVKAFHMDSIIEECLRECEKHEFAWDLHVRALLYLLITGMSRFWIRKREDFSSQLSQPHNPVIDIPAYIEQHIDEPLRVEDLARRCSLSYPWFAKRFHDHFGISCKQCIEQLRVQAVEQYLTYSDMDLAEITTHTGYTDSSHLVKDFRRMTGMTPGQYRSQMKAQGRMPFPRFSGQTAANHPQRVDTQRKNR